MADNAAYWGYVKHSSVLCEALCTVIAPICSGYC